MLQLPYRRAGAVVIRISLAYAIFVPYHFPMGISFSLWVLLLSLLVAQLALFDFVLPIN